MINRHPARTSIEIQLAAQFREVTSAWISANALTNGRAYPEVRRGPEMEMSSVVLDVIGAITTSIERAVKAIRRHPARCNLLSVLRVLHE